MKKPNADTKNRAFVRNENGLLVSRPLEPFETDCEHCKYFLPYKFSEAGKCIKKNVSGGWGCTCEEFELNIVYF